MENGLSRVCVSLVSRSTPDRKSICYCLFQSKLHVGNYKHLTASERVKLKQLVRVCFHLMDGKCRWFWLRIFISISSSPWPRFAHISFAFRCMHKRTSITQHLRECACVQFFVYFFAVRTLCVCFFLSLFF